MNQHNTTTATFQYFQLRLDLSSKSAQYDNTSLHRRGLHSILSERPATTPLRKNRTTIVHRDMLETHCSYEDCNIPFQKVLRDIVSKRTAMLPSKKCCTTWFKRVQQDINSFQKVNPTVFAFKISSEKHKKTSFQNRQRGILPDKTQSPQCACNVKIFWISGQKLARTLFKIALCQKRQSSRNSILHVQQL